MLARSAVTLIMLLLAVVASWSPSGCDNCEQYLGAPFGLLFLAIAAVVWFKWESIREGFSAAKEGPQLPIIGRWFFWDIGGMASLLRGGRRRRRSPST